jgi:hypothetical protein
MVQKHRLDVSQYGSDKPPNPRLVHFHGRETRPEMHPQFWVSKIDRSPPELGDLATRALEVPSRLSESRQGAILTSESINRTVLPYPLSTIHYPLLHAHFN